jgi:hypothetical protein
MASLPGGGVVRGAASRNTLERRAGRAIEGACERAGRSGTDVRGRAATAARDRSASARPGRESRCPEGEHADLFPLGAKTQSGLERHESSERKTAEVVRSGALDGSNLAQVAFRHRFDRLQRRRDPVEADRLHAVARNRGTQSPRELLICEDVAANRMDAEERRSRTARLNRDYARPAFTARIAAFDRVGQARDGSVHSYSRASRPSSANACGWLRFSKRPPRRSRDSPIPRSRKPCRNVRTADSIDTGERMKADQPEQMAGHAWNRCAHPRLRRQKR